MQPPVKGRELQRVSSSTPTARPLSLRTRAGRCVCAYSMARSVTRVSFEEGTRDRSDTIPHADIHRARGLTEGPGARGSAAGGRSSGGSFPLRNAGLSPTTLFPCLSSLPMRVRLVTIAASFAGKREASAPMSLRGLRQRGEHLAHQVRLSWIMVP
jgi:hypothetical protein